LCSHVRRRFINHPYILTHSVKETLSRAGNKEQEGLASRGCGYIEVMANEVRERGEGGRGERERERESEGRRQGRKGKEKKAAKESQQGEK
jgi:hypothetical protein